MGSSCRLDGEREMGTAERQLSKASVRASRFGMLSSQTERGQKSNSQCKNVHIDAFQREQVVTIAFNSPSLLP